MPLTAMVAGVLANAIEVKKNEAINSFAGVGIFMRPTLPTFF